MMVLFHQVGKNNFWIVTYQFLRKISTSANLHYNCCHWLPSSRKHAVVQNTLLCHDKVIWIGHSWIYDYWPSFLDCCKSSNLKRDFKKLLGMSFISPVQEVKPWKFWIQFEILAYEINSFPSKMNFLSLHYFN